MTAKVRSWVCRDTLTSVSHFTKPEEKQAFPNLLQFFELTPVLWSKTWNQDFFYSSFLIISCCTQGHGRVGCLQKGHWEYGSLVTVTGVSSSSTAQRAGDEEGSLPIWPEQPISWILTLRQGWAHPSPTLWELNWMLPPCPSQPTSGWPAWADRKGWY